MEEGERRNEEEEAEAMKHKRGIPALYILLAFIQAGLTSGIIFGWPALQLVLTEDGSFESYCKPTDKNIPCAAQSMYFNTIYTSAIFANNVSPLFMGVFLDKFGPKWTNLFGFLLFIAGCIPFVVRVEHLYVLGYALLGFSGPGVYVSIMHLNNLYPGHQAFILSVFSGTFGVSSLIFKIFLILYKPNSWVDLSHLFILLIVVVIPFLLLGVIFWPRKPFQLLESKDYDDPEKSFTTKKVNKLFDAPVKVQLSSLQFWFPIIWISFQALHIHSYIGSVGVMFMDYSEYISAFNWIWLGGTIAIPIFGIMLDKYGTTISFFVFSILFLLFSICKLIPILQFQYLTFVLVSVANVGVWGVLYTYLSITFGTKNYGKILGVASGVVAVTGLLQYPLLTVDIHVFHYDFFYTNLGFAVISVFLFLEPFYLWRVDLKRKSVKPLLVVNDEMFNDESEGLLSSAVESDD